MQNKTCYINHTADERYPGITEILHGLLVSLQPLPWIFMHQVGLTQSVTQEPSANHGVKAT